MAQSAKRNENKKNNKNGNKNANTTQSKKVNKKQAIQQELDLDHDGSITTEIVLCIILGLSIILFISNFGVGGTVGGAISRFFFGVFGTLSYIFPILLFFGIAFYFVNRRNSLVKRKIFGAVLLYVLLCIFFQLILCGYKEGLGAADYYKLASDTKRGGGFIGGLLTNILASSFGMIGSYVFIFFGMLIAAIIMTQKPLISYVKERGAAARDVRKQKREEKRAAKNLAHEGNSQNVFRIGEIDLKQNKESFEKDFSEKRVSENVSANVLLETEKGSSQMAFKIQRGDEVISVQDDTEDSYDASSGSLEPVRPLTKKDFFKGNFLKKPADVKQNSKKNENKNQEQAHDIVEITPVTEVELQENMFEEVPSDSIDSIHLEPIESDAEALNEDAVTTRRLRNPKSSKEEIETNIAGIKEEIAKKPEKKKKAYKNPPLSLLSPASKSRGDSNQYLRETALKLQQTLHSFGVEVTVTNASCGPTVTRFELQPEQGVKVSKILNLTNDLKLNLAASELRIEAPVPGKAVVGIEVPNKEPVSVMLRELLQSDAYVRTKASIPFAVGKDIAGNAVVVDIAKMPHLLIAGATGSGKSVCINTLIMSILYKAHPDEVKLMMIDPKVVELSAYNGIPHLLIPVVTDPKKAAGALNWAVAEMTDRYNIFADFHVRDLAGYNEKAKMMIADPDIPEEDKPKLLPKIVIIVDELADLMMVAPGEVEDAICRLAQLARACGIHLIIATQRPSVNVITGLIKANMPSRIAFSVSSSVDSRTIIDMGGAEKLLGNGDMLFYPQSYPKPVRLQGGYIKDEEVNDIVNFLSSQRDEVVYNNEIESKINAVASSASAAAKGSDRDAYFAEAGMFIIEKDKASIGMLQRVFKIGFNRAARIMDQLCEAGVVGEEEGTKPRKVLMSAEQFEQYIDEYL